MGKKLRSGISMLLALSMLCVSLEGLVPVSFAESNPLAASAADSDYTYTTSGSSATVTGYIGSSTELDIPSEINGVAVKAIAASAFSGNTSITSVTIPEGVTTIGYKAFYGCTSLKSVSIPSTITSWDDYDSSNSYNGDNFYGCTALTSLTLADGLTILGQRAFYGCSALTSVVIPSTITEFHHQVFGECTSLTDITLSEGLTVVGYGAFYGCTALKEVTIPSSITTWSAYSRAPGIMAVTHNCTPFGNCTSLEKVTFSDGLTTLYNFYGFKGCESLKEVIVPDSVTDIQYAFCASDYLEKVTLGNGIKSVGTNAFYNCTALKEVVIPDSVTTFDYYAFQGCSALECLVVPKNFTYTQSLSGLSSLKTVLFLSNSAQYNAGFVANSNTMIYAISGTTTYSNFFTGMSNAGTVNRLVELPSDNIKATAYEGEYDGNEHEALEISGAVDGIEVMYSLDGGEVSTEIPKITSIGTYSINVFKKYEEIDTLILVDTVEAKISKRAVTIELNDITADEGKDYIVEPESYNGDGKLVYTYYKDAALTQECEKPTTAGTYYVKALSEETELCLAGESNTAKIVISKAVTPINTTNPANTVKPTTKAPASAATKVTAATRNAKVVAADKAAAEKAMKQAKITKLTVKSKAKKKITATWKKVKKAVGFEVQVSANKKFKKSKIIYDKFTAKKKLTIKNSKLKSKKTYYVRVRAYATYKDANNTPVKVYSTWNKKLRKVTVK